MQVDILELMKTLFPAQGAQVLLVSELPELSGRIDYNLRQQLFQNFDYSAYLKQLSAQLEAGTLHHIEDDFRFSYSILAIPQTAEEYAGQYLFIGPVRFHNITKGEFQKVAEEKRLHPDLYQKLIDFYSGLPVWSSFDNWSAVLAIFSSLLMGGANFHTKSILYNDTDAKQAVAEHISPEQIQLSRSTIEARYQAEELLLRAVAAGNVEKALTAVSQIKQYKMLPRTPDPVRNTKNTTLILNTLLRKAVQQSCVHPIYIDALSQDLAVQIESASSLSALDTLPTNMIRKYCLLVRNHSHGKNSPIICFCLDYIDFHYVEALSLSVLAEKCGVSDSYLSALFRKEMNMTLTDYILQTRMTHAIYLLNTTQLSIQTIASQCGFEDGNYFTRVFKRKQGQSPRQYRKSIKA